jgi:hypothetical protein
LLGPEPGVKQGRKSRNAENYSLLGLHQERMGLSMRKTVEDVKILSLPKSPSGNRLKTEVSQNELANIVADLKPAPINLPATEMIKNKNRYKTPKSR